jgi:hypothetical protein
MTINKSEVNGNMATGTGGVASGGGIFNADIGALTGATNSGVLTINNSQVNSNSAGGVGGGIANGLPSPKMPLPGGMLTLNHSQVTANSAALGGGGIFNVGGVVSLASTSISGNNPDNCLPHGSISGCAG